MTRVICSSSRLSRRGIVDINHHTVLLRQAIVILVAAVVRRLKKQLAIVVWATILPCIRNVKVVGAVLSMKMSAEYILSQSYDSILSLSKDNIFYKLQLTKSLPYKG